MRLVSLRMKNFRQHADTFIAFRAGLTGIIGPNGAGKSTLLEAIAWAIYGAQAARGTNDTIRFSRAQPRSRVEVELVFGLGGHEYRVFRTLHNAEVFLDGQPVPVAATLVQASVYLQQRLGMSREEFFNTYFTGQKELQFLAAMGPADRGRFLSQVLGYERLRRAQDMARDRKKELRAEIRGLQSSLGDLGELVEARIDAQKRMSDTLSAYSKAQTETVEAASALKAFLPRWEKAHAGPAPRLHKGEEGPGGARVAAKGFPPGGGEGAGGGGAAGRAPSPPPPRGARRGGRPPRRGARRRRAGRGGEGRGRAGAA